jgi:ribose 5-phosphate isomerase B
LVTARDLEDAPQGSDFEVPKGALVTPLARELAAERMITLVDVGVAPAPFEVQATLEVPAREHRKIAVGADHGGFDLKESIKRQLGELGYDVIDCGTDSRQSVDYPDFALAVAQLVSAGQAWRGILVDGAGIGSCMVANKVPGVRAAMCYDQATAANSREHNDANLLTLGAGMTHPDRCREIVRIWLQTPAAGGRHARRVGKIMDIERKFARKG